MAIKSVVKMGNKNLSLPSSPLENFEQYGKHFPGITSLIQDMQDTMLTEGGVGIAAPQIGYNQRVIMYGFEKNERYPSMSSIPFNILINPELKPLSDEMIDGWEGCLSIPGLRGLVSRYVYVEYAGFDLEGNRVHGKAEGFFARVLQHECDHLDGILYPQRIKNLKNFGFEGALEI